MVNGSWSAATGWGLVTAMYGVGWAKFAAIFRDTHNLIEAYERPAVAET